MRLIIFLALLNFILPPASYAAEKVFIIGDPAVGRVYVLNINERNIDRQCLLEKVKTIINYIDTEQVIRSEEKIWRQSPIFRQAVSSQTIKIERGEDSIYIPIAFKGDRIIVYQNESYSLLGVISKDKNVDFDECLKRN